MNNKLFLTVSICLFTLFSFAQPNSSDSGIKNVSDIFVLTWNKNTPEQEMKDDIKAFAEKGVSVSYKNVKRNERQEITAIEVSYETKIGEKGSLIYDNIKPIGTIKIYKLANEVGFGDAPNLTAGLAFSSSFPKDDNLMNNFKSMTSSESSTTSSVRKQILRSDRMPLLIENGKVIEGGSDYTMEEINEILNTKDDSLNGNTEFKSFNYKGNQDFSEEIQKMQKQIDALTEKQKKLESEKKEEPNKKIENSKK